MRKFLLLLMVSCSILSANATTDSIPADPADVGSADAIVAALYNVISGPSGQSRNWDRLRTLFLPEAKLIASGRREGRIIRRVMTVEDYIKASGPALEKDGWFETEIGRKSEQFDNMVHAFSTYSAKRSVNDTKPYIRGINSFQLLNDGKRWWIVNLLWQWESTDAPIPEKYITK